MVERPQVHVTPATLDKAHRESARAAALACHSAASMLAVARRSEAARLMREAWKWSEGSAGAPHQEAKATPAGRAAVGSYSAIGGYGAASGGPKAARGAERKPKPPPTEVVEEVEEDANDF